MAPISKPNDFTVNAIYAAYEAEREKRGEWEGLGISISNLGDECDRALWYGFRWVSKAEKVDGLKAIVFETGNLEEARLIKSLRMIGCEVQDVDPATGKQWRFSAAHGHVRGKADGKVLGLPEAPKTWHALECKSAKQEYYNPVVKKGVKLGYLSHYVQATTYGYLGGLDRSLYMLRNKNTGAIHTERLAIDPAESIAYLARGERIAFTMTKPPKKLHENPKAKAAYKCGICRHFGVCHDRVFPRVTCRSCIHATPMKDGDAAWHCARWAKPLSAEEQRQACPAHLFLPSLVPGEALTVDEVAETITYRLDHDGSTWTDGGGKPAATDEAAS